MFAARNNFLTPVSVGGSYTLGLSDPLLTFGGQNAAWNQQTIDISSYGGATVRFVMYYQTTTSFRADIQLDDVNIDGTLYTFASGSEGWQTTTVDQEISGVITPYTSASFSTVATGTAGNRWNRDSGGTPSGSTGLTIDHTSGTTSGYYLYAETSVTHPFGYWLRSPEVTLSGSPTLSFWEARYGSEMGTATVYLDVIS